MSSLQSVPFSMALEGGTAAPLWTRDSILHEGDPLHPAQWGLPLESQNRHKPHPNTAFTERSFIKQGRKVKVAAFKLRQNNNRK